MTTTSHPNTRTIARRNRAVIFGGDGRGADHRTTIGRLELSTGIINGTAHDLWMYRGGNLVGRIDLREDDAIEDFMQLIRVYA